MTPDGYFGACTPRTTAPSCDTENVLIYNVGTGSFRHLVEAGLAFERGFDVPPAPSGETFGHYHSYVSAERDAPACWATHRVISQWRARVPKNRASTAAWWLATSSALSTAVDDITGRPFRLRLRVAQGAMAVHSELKPMLDGIVAAQHVDLTPSSLPVQRLSATLNVPARDLDGSCAQTVRLDSSALVHPYRAGIQ